MPSKSSATGRGFSLLELIVVLAIAGLAAGLTAAALARTGPAAARSRALQEAVVSLGVARVQAMRQGQPVDFELRVERDALILRVGDRTRQWGVTGLSPASPLSASFDPAGRTAARTWRLTAADPAATLFVIVFDPISGAPKLRRPSDGRLTTEAELP